MAGEQSFKLINKGRGIMARTSNTSNEIVGGVEVEGCMELRFLNEPVAKFGIINNPIFENEIAELINGDSSTFSRLLRIKQDDFEINCIASSKYYSFDIYAKYVEDVEFDESIFKFVRALNVIAEAAARENQSDVKHFVNVVGISNCKSWGDWFHFCCQECFPACGFKYNEQALPDFTELARYAQFRFKNKDIENRWAQEISM